jgi:uncharacterized membrane protein AbrB (regulator of aidB expression)
VGGARRGYRGVRARAGGARAPPFGDTKGWLITVAAAVLGVIAACFGLAAVLNLTAGVSLLDAYLATTPGGIYAVLAIAFGAKANTTFILATQGLRLVVMMVLAPLAVRRMFSRQAMAGAPSGRRSSAD